MLVETAAHDRAPARTRQGPPLTSEQADRIRRIRRTGAYVLLIVSSAMFLLPFLWMLTTSLKSDADNLAFPPQWLPDSFHFENYIKGWSGSLPFTKFLVNTIVITGLSMAGNLISCVLPAYAFARMRAPAAGIMFGALMATMMIPREITLVPKFIMFSKLGWVDTYLPLIVPEFFGVALYIFLLRQFFTTIPQELIDAARIDGASELRILWSVMLPLARPAIAAICLFSFVGNWNQYLENSIYLRSMDKITLAQGLGMFSGQYVTQYNQMMAVSIISMMPILIVFFLAQKTFIRGVTLTGIAGR
ncbi:carbohydrate ABC transporter permease [Nonomuraea aurantiaca]|jgi:multiple sugar transport system permease protein|uniref:carbohydrate ABC transporter permease n=1 Tax=Nonomuraea aurantiaca TaxID=2878562 RepID=UPI001CD92210|nr:carbohydrate ABC transporter permease [Nonomuraea aurantiaca]MCA2226916.1 carbohydrate ABC transporter permease [Nonomuraea aurantiaca]